jgi:UDP-N-acetylmuramoyl-tripeptide--D-alanyl-D-alanine ligase
MALWSSEELKKITSGDVTGKFEVGGVSIDTRTIKPNDLFIAVKGSTDGHKYIKDAFSKGASAVLVEKKPKDLSENIPILVVKNSAHALRQIGVAARKRCKAKVIAITGSVGKTSTKEMIKLALEGQGIIHAAEKSYNNHWGVPLTLANMPEMTKFAIFEIGTSNPGEILPLAQMIRPDVAIITAIAEAHLAAFKSLNEITKEKTSILSALKENGLGIINADEDQLSFAGELVSPKIKTFGCTETADWKLHDIKFFNSKMIYKISAKNEIIYVKINALGVHHAMNSVAALCAIDCIGADLGRAVLKLGYWSSLDGRGARTYLAFEDNSNKIDVILVDESYNANPASVTSALDVLGVSKAPHPQGRKIAILGDMKELGPKEILFHENLETCSAIKDITLVHCVGSLMQALFYRIPEIKRGLWSPDVEHFCINLKDWIKSGDIIMVKGSLSTGMVLIVDEIKKLGHSIEHLGEEEL